MTPQTINTPYELGCALRKLRQDRGLTQRQVAEALGISQRWVSELEAGKPGLFTDRLFSFLNLLEGTLVAQRQERRG